ncbi:MAG: signal peptidase I [Streptococcaceae bacterium]|nr:signal peptidase I [Streptococcaceae bacterium]
MSKKDLIQTLVILAIVPIIVLILRINVFAPVNVAGNSMYPTLANKEQVIILKHQKISRFDLITFKSPLAKEKGKNYIKRVIGLPGDDVSYMDDVLYINGKVFYEPYLDEQKKTHKNGELFTEDFTLATVTNESPDKQVVVPANSYFVLGDNRPNSKDSRGFGFVKASDVLGEVKFAYWPLDKFGPISTIIEKEKNGLVDD